MLWACKGIVMTYRLNRLLLIFMIAVLTGCQQATPTASPPDSTAASPTLAPIRTSTPAAALPSKAEFQDYLSIGSINRMELSPDGKSLALLTGSGLRVYDFATFAPLWEDLSIGARYDDYWLAWSPDGAHVAATVALQTIVWDAATGERKWEITT